MVGRSEVAPLETGEGFINFHTKLMARYKCKKSQKTFQIGLWKGEIPMAGIYMIVDCYPVISLIFPDFADINPSTDITLQGPL